MASDLVLTLAIIISSSIIVLSIKKTKFQAPSELLVRKIEGLMRIYAGFSIIANYCDYMRLIQQTIGKMTFALLNLYIHKSVLSLVSVVQKYFRRKYFIDFAS